MKTIKQLLFLLGIGLTLIACKKESSSPFSETAYSNLSAYDHNGKPTSGLMHDVISDSLLAFIDSLLPESQNLPVTHPELFSSSAIADVAISQTSDV